MFLLYPFHLSSLFWCNASKKHFNSFFSFFLNKTRVKDAR